MSFSFMSPLYLSTWGGGGGGLQGGRGRALPRRQAGVARRQTKAPCMAATAQRHYLLAYPAAACLDPVGGRRRREVAGNGWRNGTLTGEVRRKRRHAGAIACPYCHERNNSMTCLQTRHDISPCGTQRRSPSRLSALNLSSETFVDAAHAGWRVGSDSAKEETL